MSKFNWKLINQPNTVVHCETEEQARELLAEADRMGFRWFSFIGLFGLTNIRWRRCLNGSENIT